MNVIRGVNSISLQRFNIRFVHGFDVKRGVDYFIADLNQ